MFFFCWLGVGLGFHPPFSRKTMNPFKIDSPTCISFSGGRTSAYMLWRVLEANAGLPADAIVCFCNTGKEDESTLQFVHDCNTYWGVEIHWLEYRSDNPKFVRVTFETASRNGEPFDELTTKRRYLPNPVARFCTSELKVLTIDRYLKSLGIDEFETMVGIRADEPRRAAKMRSNKLTPLLDAHVYQEDVQSFWRNHEFDLGIRFADGVTALGNCDLCFLKGPKQIMSLISTKPDRAVWWAQQEQKIGGTFRNDRPSYQKMMDFSRDQTDMFDVNEEGIACFCGD
jgi:3'-phosphoadenosine 5'-phosphosulfate sulfotransferase (PAPS reductase)/FAD synthetase